MAQAQDDMNGTAISVVKVLRIFNDALNALPEVQRVAVTMGAIEGLSLQVKQARPKTAPAIKTAAVKKTAKATAAKTNTAAGDAKPAAEATAPANPAAEATAPAKRGRKAAPKLAAPPANAQAASGAAAAA